MTTVDHKPHDLTLPDAPDGDPGDWSAAELDEYAAIRARRAPYVMGAITAGVGAAAWSCTQIAEAFGGVDAATAVGAITWVGTAAAVPALRAVFRHRIPELWRRRWWLSTAAAAAWVDVVAVQGPALLTVNGAVGAAATLLLGGVALGARWADEHDLSTRDDDGGGEEVAPKPVPLKAAPRLPEIDTGRAAEIEWDWQTEVAGGRNPIAPGSELQRRTHLPHGYRWLVQLDRGGSVGCTALETEGVAAQVALKLGMRATHIMLERLDGDDDREDRALLTAVTRDALKGGVDYDRPRYDTGRIPIGQYADGTGEPFWVAYDATGVRCGLVTGGQGSGKSALMAALGLSYRVSGEWILLFGDGDESGSSSPLLSSIAHDVARGPAEVLQQLEGLEAWGRIRGTFMGTLTGGPDGKPVPMSGPGQPPVDKILPCPAYPGVVWILDEFHKLANNPELQAANFVFRVGVVVRTLRKFGGAVIIGTQSQLGDDFDGDSAFRGMVSQGNNVLMRSNNKSEQGITSDAGFSATSLPKGAGYAFLDDGARKAMIRAADPTTMPQWVPYVQQFGAPDERSWAAFTRYRAIRELDPVVDYEERVNAMAEFDAAVATGAPLPGSPEARAAGDDTGDAGGAAPLAFGGFTVPGAVGNVVPIRSEIVDTPPTEPAVRTRALSDKAQRVLAVLHSHPQPWKTSELEHATGLAKPDVSKALAELVAGRVAHRPTGKQGVYAAGPPKVPA